MAENDYLDTTGVAANDAAPAPAAPAPGASTGLLKQMASVPMLFPDGSKSMVPQEKVSSAISQGQGKIAHAMQFPDGSKAYVSVDRIHDAITQGQGKLVDADTTLPQSSPVTSAVKAVGSFLGSAAGILGQVGEADTPMQPSTGEQVAEARQQSEQFTQNDQSRKAAGYNIPYRVAAGVGERTGLSNPAQMEQAASEGRMGDVAGQAVGEAAAPIATAEIAKRGVEPAAELMNIKESRIAS